MHRALFKMGKNTLRHFTFPSLVTSGCLRNHRISYGILYSDVANGQFKPPFEMWFYKGFPIFNETASHFTIKKTLMLQYRPKSKFIKNVLSGRKEINIYSSDVSPYLCHILYGVLIDAWRSAAANLLITLRTRWWIRGGRGAKGAMPPPALYK